jgi:hypothetical protein
MKALRSLKGVQVKIVYGLWIDKQLTDRYRQVAKVTAALEGTKKREHQWIAVGPVGDLNTSDEVTGWYKSAVVFDPTFFQFTLEENDDKDWQWTAEECFNVKDKLRVLPHECLRHWGREVRSMP